MTTREGPVRSTRFPGWRAALAFALVAWTGAASAQGFKPPEDLVAAQLIAERAGVAPGGRVSVGLDLVIKPGWHVYWRNPGDAGLPTEITWSLPQGWTAGPLEWPTPEHFTVGTVADYGYGGHVLLPVAVTASAEARVGDAVLLKGEANWLVCSDICVPGSASLTITLPIIAPGAASSPTEHADAFAQARAATPVPAPFQTRFRVDADAIALEAPGAAVAGLENPRAEFLPYVAGVINHGAPQRLNPGRESFGLSVKRDTAATTPLGDTLEGVLILRGGSAGREVTRRFEVRATAASGAVAPVGDGEGAPGLVEALGLAFLGGLILNLMPCVFPILSLKLLAIARLGAGERRTARIDGLAYGAGVLLSFALLGGLLIGLRATGAAVGWGFQLQSPALIAVLVALLFAMGLSLSGAIEFGASITGVGARWARHSGPLGAFATGALATVVATPCTAPFMGAALGYALAAPAGLGMAVFLALGAGLAAPFTVASFVPALQRVLPRPGAWMEVLKQALAFPVYATVAWLVWVANAETAGAALPALLAILVLIGFAIWCLGRTRDGGRHARWFGGGVAALGFLAVVGLITTLEPDRSRAASVDGGADAAVGRPEAFSTARLEALRAEGRPVFVNFTAAWCVTCLVNERTTLETDAVRRRFGERGVAYLKGDWTNQDAEIGRVLREYGRVGVPLYLFYEAGKGSVTVLPQILTPSTVLAVIGQVGPGNPG